MQRDVQEGENRSGAAATIPNASLPHGINPFLKNVPNVMLISFLKSGIKRDRQYSSVIKKNADTRKLKKRHQKKLFPQGLYNTKLH